MGKDGFVIRVGEQWVSRGSKSKYVAPLTGDVLGVRFFKSRGGAFKTLGRLRRDGAYGGVFVGAVVLLVRVAVEVVGVVDEPRE
jgi:hypothetical protein